MDLFLKPNLQFEKVAGSVLMPEDPNQWPQEVLQELYKQIPFIHEFQPHVEMDKVDAEKGYGFGHITVTTQTEMQQGASQDTAAAAGVKEVKIPIVIKDSRLYPLDLLLTSDHKMFPLTEDRLRSAVFRPQAFDVTSKTPGDNSMIGQLYPPYRQNYGGGGGGLAMTAGMGKQANIGLGKALTKVKERSMPTPSHDDADALMVMASANTGSILEAILPTINSSDLQDFTSKIANDQDIRLAYEMNAAAVLQPLTLLLSHIPHDTAKTAAAFSGMVRPTIMQLARSEGGYTLKTANAKFWAPIETTLTRGEALQKCGAKLVMAADMHGSVTETAEEGVSEAEPQVSTAAPPGPITTFGMYTVHTEDGQELSGYVFPKLIDAVGKEVPLALFTDGQNAAIQTDIVGSATDGEVQLPTGESPNGYGFFFAVEGPEVKATVPMFVKGSYRGVSPEEPSTYMAESFDGVHCELSVQPNIQTAMGTPEGKLLIPAHWQWMQLNSAATTALVSSEEEFEQPEELKEAMASVYVAGDHNCFSIRGHLVEKLASTDRDFLSVDQAMFLLAGLGVNLDYGVQKLAASVVGKEPVRVCVGHGIKLASEAVGDSYTKAKTAMVNLPNFRRDLVKEAAMVTDPEAVDMILSLGFVNPENVSTFISYLPQLEIGLGRLCELLLASRIGLNEIPDTALEKAVVSTEEVIKGLKALAFQGADGYN